MSYKINFIHIILVLVTLMTACSGEDGDPGPQGEQGVQGEKGPEGENGTFKAGYFEGTITGTRKDGSSLSEPFSFEYTNDSLIAFYEKNGSKYITLYKTGYYGYFEMNLKLNDDGNLVVDSLSNNYCRFSYGRVLESDTVFEINASPYFQTKSAYTLILSKEAQEVYNFNTSWADSNPYYWTGTHPEIGEQIYEFYTSNYYVYYSKSDGKLISVSNGYTDSYQTEGDVFDHFNELKFMQNDDLGIPVFYDAESGEALYEVLPDIPADKLTIENYKRDETTGVITFDYELKISEYSLSPRENSTDHELTISGSFNSGTRIYTNIINRIGG